MNLRTRLRRLEGLVDERSQPGQPEEDIDTRLQRLACELDNLADDDESYLARSWRALREVLRCEHRP